MFNRSLIACWIGTLLLAGTPDVNAKEHSRFVTAEMRARAVANAEKFPWVREQQLRAVSAAEPWVNRTDDELWLMVPAQEVPRTIYTTQQLPAKAGRFGLES